MALLQSKLVELEVRILKGTVPAMDKVLRGLSRGWLSSGLQTVAPIETTGAKSGISRNIVNWCMPHADSLIVVGSNWAGPATPPGCMQPSVPALPGRPAINLETADTSQ